MRNRYFKNDTPLFSKLKKCGFCGEMFEAHHGLQMYCPEKNGKLQFCKYEHKKLVSESKLVDIIKTLSQTNRPHEIQTTQIQRNIKVLEILIGNSTETITNSAQLDAMGFDIKTFSSRYHHAYDDSISLIIGPYTLDWIESLEQIHSFKISRI
jgi:ribosomal protein L24E